jgi:hypothetical protein
MININYNGFLISEICDKTFSNHVIKKIFHEKLLVSSWFRKELFNNRVVKKTSDEIFSDNVI